MSTLAHVGICSLDPEQLATWYERVLGLERLSSNGKEPPTVFASTADGVALEFYPAGEDEPERPNQVRGIRHLAFSTSQIDLERDRLAAAGVSLLGDVTLHPNGARTLFFRDGEGNVLHFVQRREP